MFSNYDEYDKRRDRYSFYSYDEIDADQSIKLLKLLNLWAEAKIEIPDLLLRVSYIVGVNAITPVWDYHIQAQVVENLGKSNLNPKVKDKIFADVKTVVRANGATLHPEIVDAIVQVEESVANGDLDSWDLARAIHEVVLEPYALRPDTRTLEKKEADFKWGREYKTGRWHDFIKTLDEQKERYLYLKTKDIQSTLDSIKPETEEDVKKTLSQAFNEQNKTPNKDRVFKSPITFPNHQLCDAIDIVANGTGLVNIYRTQWAEDKIDEEFNGATVARITTYNLSFHPINSETDLNALKEVIETAIPLLGDIPYRHELSKSWDAYERPKGKGDYWGNMNYKPKNWAYIDPENGAVRLDINLDLDDTWYLYYLLEPIIKPTQQIATAMNLARYSEERGVILEPDFYPGNYEHYVDDEADYLGEDENLDMFTRTIKASMTAYFLRQSDEAEFLMRAMTIADQTAQGRMKDKDGKYISYHDYKLLENDQNSERTNLISYSDYVTERTTQILKDFLLLSETASQKDIFPTLRKLDEQVGGYIREYHATNRINRNESLAASFRSRMSQPVGEIDEMSELSEQFMIERYGNLEGPEDRDTTLPTLKNQLVVADSNVETGLDGSRKGYRIRLKGSPFMRKNIPSALKPFMNDQENAGSGVQRLMHFMK